MATDTLQTESAPATSEAWTIALRNYERATAAHLQAVDAYNEAEKVCLNETRGGLDYCERYSLRCGDTPERQFRAAQMAILMRDYLGRDRISGAEHEAVDAEARQAVEGFAAQLKAKKEVAERHNLDALDAAVNASSDVLLDAETRLYNTPAPAAETLLEKLELLTDKMIEYDENDAERIAAIRDDARRLLAASKCREKESA